MGWQSTHLVREIGPGEAVDVARKAVLRGAAEPGSPRPFSVGYVVAVPRPGAPPVGEGLSGLEALREYYDVLHSSAELPEEWSCDLNPDPAYASCEVPQELSDVEIARRLGLAPSPASA